MFTPFRRPFTGKLHDRANHLSASRSAHDAALRLGGRPRFEALETRQMLSVFTVTNAGDNGSDTNPLPGSLRAEVVAAEALPAGTYSTINFHIPLGGLEEIQLQSPLPLITNPVNINGLSQRDSSATIPLIQIDGASAGAGASGLEIASSASGTATKPTQVSGLELTDFGDGGVTVEDASYVNLNDLFVGVTKQGASFLDEGNGSYGVLLAGGSHDTLSGSVVSANQGTGVYVGDASYDSLTGDFIGTDVTGELALDQNGNTLGNNGNGVMIYAGATYTTVTKTVIGNNNGQGVELSDEGTSHNTLSLDNIGTELLGSHALPNLDGVLITNSASYNTIGGTTSSFNDLISGNASAGVALSNGADFNIIVGDFIGVTSNGASALGNGDSGVNVSGGATTTPSAGPRPARATSSRATSPMACISATQGQRPTWSKAITSAPT